MPEFGKMIYLENKNKGITHNLEDQVLAKLRDVQPEVVINQAPYLRNLRSAILKYQKSNHCYTIACIHNSLFSFKNNLSSILEVKIPFPFQKVVNNRFGREFIQKLHQKKHGIELKNILSSHDRLVLLTPPNIDELRYFVEDFAPGRVIAIPNTLPGIRAPKEKEKIILHVGRLNVAQKRSDLLLPFWEKALAKLPEWRFVIVGDGGYFKILKDLQAAKRLPRMELMGYQDPMPFYDKASIFMLPSAFEGFPNTILEAHSSSLPVIAFNSYLALPWIVNDGEDALLSPPYNVHHMADQAVALASDKALLERMSSAATRNAGRFTIEAVGIQWLNLFEELKNESPVS